MGLRFVGRIERKLLRLWQARHGSPPVVTFVPFDGVRTSTMVPFPSPLCRGRGSMPGAPRQLIVQQ